MRTNYASYEDIDKIEMDDCYEIEENNDYVSIVDDDSDLTRQSENGYDDEDEDEDRDDFVDEDAIEDIDDDLDEDIDESEKTTVNKTQKTKKEGIQSLATPARKTKTVFTTEEAIAIMDEYHAGRNLIEKSEPVLRVLYNLSDNDKLNDVMLRTLPDDLDDNSIAEVKKTIFDYERGCNMIMEAKTQMISKLSLFIYNIISKQFSTFTKYTSDLYNEAVIGILKGFDTYDPHIAKPSTFFRIYMVHEITEYINTHINKTTSHYAAHIIRVKRALNDFRKDGREPSAKEIAQETGISAETVVQALKINEMKNEVHYDSPELLDTKLTESIKSPEQAMIEMETQNLIAEAVNKLTQDERDVIALKYGLTGFEPMAYKTISAKTGISIDQVKKLHNRAIRKLRKDSTMRKNFKNFIKEEKLLNQGTVGIVPVSVGEEIEAEVDMIPLEAL